MEMEKYLKELQKTEDLLSLTNEELLRFARNTDDFIAQLKIMTTPLKNHQKYVRELLRVGLSVEAAIVYREQARTYNETDREKEYLKNLYRYYETLLTTLYLPPVYEELKANALLYENTTLGPLFYYLVGFTQHFHLFEYEKAYDTYSHALNLFGQVKEKEFNRYDLIKYDDFKLILLSNMIDTLLRSLFKEGENKDHIGRIRSHLEELKKIEKDRLFLAVNEIEFNLATGNIQEAAKLLMDIETKLCTIRPKGTCFLCFTEHGRFFHGEGRTQRER